jgi:hypothetical protein
MNSSSTEAIPGYRNTIFFKERTGWQIIARVDHNIEWKFEVDYREGSTTDKGFIQIMSQVGPTNTRLTGGIQTIRGTGNEVWFSWERAQGSYLNFRANPFNTNTPDPWPIAVYAERETYIFQLGGGPTSPVRWKIDIFVGLPGGSSAKTMQIISNNSEVLGTLQEGPNSFSNLASESISVQIEDLKGTMKIGYTLTETEKE